MAVEIGDVAVAEVVAAVVILGVKVLAAKVHANREANGRSPLLDDLLVISMTNQTTSFWKTMLIWKTSHTSPKKSNVLAVHVAEVRIAANAVSVSIDQNEGIVIALNGRSELSGQNVLNGASDRCAVSDQGVLNVGNVLSAANAESDLNEAIVLNGASGQSVVNAVSDQNDIEDVTAVKVVPSVKLVSHAKAANLVRVANRVKAVVHPVNVLTRVMWMLAIVDQWNLEWLRSFRTSRLGKRRSAACRCERQPKITLAAQRTVTRRATTVRLVDGISNTL